MGEKLYELPKGWGWVALDSLCTTIGDVNHKMPKAQETGIPYISTRDFLENGTIAFEKSKKISEEDYKKLSIKIYPEKGDILLSRYGTVGEVILVKTDKLFQASYSIAIIKPVFHKINNFIATAIKSDIVQSQIRKYIRGVAQPDLGLGHIRELYLPFPPLAEQYRILNKIEELFTEVDAGVELLKKLKAKLKRYRQAVLKAAVEGNLTKEWREANQGKLEPASMLFDRMVQNTGSVRVRRDVPENVEKIEEIENLKIPSIWNTVSVAELLRKGGLLDIKDGNHGTNHPKSNEFSDQGLPFITAAQVENFRVDHENAPKLQGQVLDKLKVGFSYKGDVILTHKGSVGRVGICTENCVLSPQTTYYRVNECFLNKKYIASYLASPIFQSQLSKIKSQTTRDFVSISKQYKLFLVIPPFLEQEKVVEEVELRLSVIDQLEKTIDSNLKRAGKLRQSILKQAFEGKLVPQDPNDEPAEELLEQIKAEKAKHEAENKPKRQSKTKSSQPRKSPTTAIQLELNFDE